MSATTEAEKVAVAMETLAGLFGVAPAQIDLDTKMQGITAGWLARFSVRMFDDGRKTEREAFKADMLALMDAAGSLEVNGFCLAVIVRAEARP